MQTIFLPILIPEFVVKTAEKSLEVGEQIKINEQK